MPCRFGLINPIYHVVSFDILLLYFNNVNNEIDKIYYLFGFFMFGVSAKRTNLF